MEAAMVSAWYGALDSLLGKLGDLLANKYKVLREAKAEIMFLEAELQNMHAFLKKMSDVEELDEQTKCWAKEIRELSYDIEDNIDEFKLRVEHDPHRTLRRHGFINRCISLLTTIKTRHQITKELQGLARHVVEVSERRMRYKVDDAVSKLTGSTIDPRMLALYAETTGLVGINGPMEELIQMMMMMDKEDMNTQQLKVFSVEGFGGLGKTTLANEVYRKLQGQFECQSFVSVSHKPNLRRILRNILTQVGYASMEQNNMEIWDENELISTLRKFLLDKRYFIVVDDIWDASSWNIIRCALPENKRGSRVLTTTRIETVAIASCCSHYEHVYKMRPLSSEDSKILFFKRIFGSEDGCPSCLEEAATYILKRCGGLPLAIITISSLLATQGNKLMKDKWDFISNSLGSNVEVNPTLEGIRHILSLSYVNLPHNLKTCMLYLGIYPEDHTIDKNDLVRHWVAQGFISKVPGQDIEDTAEGYFNELVNRSIIQPGYNDRNDDVRSWRVHDMMLDLILYKCREENFITTTDNIKDNVRLHDKVRRLSLYLDGVIDCNFLGTVQLSQVRVLAIFGDSIYIPNLREFKHLRVLCVKFINRNDQDQQLIIDLSGIYHLFQLKYLKISSCDKIALPGKVRGLQLLETLEIEGSIVEVPPDVVHLRQLTHLIVPQWICLPAGVGNMKSLRTLWKFDLGMNSIDNIRDLGNLTNLRDLNIRYVHQKQSDDKAMKQRRDALRSSLEKLCNLKHLRLYARIPYVWMDELSSLSSCPHFLQTLDMWFWSLTVPKWISGLHNLHQLQLGVKEVLPAGVEILAQLPSLVRLYLHIRGAPHDNVVIAATGFSILKHFTIACRRISCLNFDVGAMKKLEMLEIRFDAQGWDKNNSAPTGIEHLSDLKEIYVKIGARGAGESSVRAAESALRNAIDMHPGRPTANVACRDNSHFVSAVQDVAPFEDGFSWRIYGEKDIAGAKHPRRYYRCIHRHNRGCPATKQVQRRDDDPLLFDVEYHMNHTCADDKSP